MKKGFFQMMVTKMGASDNFVNSNFHFLLKYVIFVVFIPKRLFSNENYRFQKDRLSFFHR